MVFTLLICFVLPILAMGVLKIRMRAQILLFLVGISMHLVFVMLLERLFMSLTIQAVPGIGENAVLYTGPQGSRLSGGNVWPGAWRP